MNDGTDDEEDIPTFIIMLEIYDKFTYNLTDRELLLYKKFERNLIYFFIFNCFIFYSFLFIGIYKLFNTITS